MKILRIVLIALASLLHCKEDTLNRLLLPAGGSKPGVLASYPAAGMTGIGNAENLWVVFNTKMDEQRTQSAFRISSSAGPIPGAFRWEGQKMIFSPARGLNGTQEFSMVVGKEAESSSGIDLSDDFIVRFHASNDTTEPVFTGSIPQNGSTGWAAGGDILLRFSEAMDLASAGSGVTISPYIAVTKIQDEDRSQIILRPASPLANGTYSIQMTTQLKDAAGNSLRENASISFTVGSDFSRPTVLQASSGFTNLTEGIRTDGVDRRSNLTVTFSEPMDRISAENSVSISPAAPGIKTWNTAGDILTIVFSPYLNSQTEYTLTISGAKDAAGNYLLNDCSFPFFTNAGTSLRPEILEIRQEIASPSGIVDNAAGSGVFSASFSDYDVVLLSEQIDENPAAGSSVFTIHLRIVFSNSMVRTSLLANTYFTPVIDPSAANVQIYDIQLDGGSVGTIMTLKLQGPFPGLTGIPVYKLRFAGGSGGIQDTNGNTLISDFVLYVSF